MAIALIICKRRLFFHTKISAVRAGASPFGAEPNGALKSRQALLENPKERACFQLLFSPWALAIKPINYRKN
jgi:hypothetical protein